MALIASALLATAPAAAGLLAGCGARSEGALGQRAGTEGPDAAAPDAKPLDVTLSLLASGIVVMPDEKGDLGFARVVPRDGEIDVLINRYNAPFSVFARHARVSMTEPFVQWQTDPTELLPGVVSGTVAAASGNVLSICHNQFGGDPVSFSSFTGVYTKASGPSFISDQASCQGLAYQGDKGLLAYHARPPTGCCSRVLVVDVDSAGQAQGEPSLALPEGEFGDVRVSAYAGGFAWAGFSGYQETKQILLRFRREGTLTMHSFAAQSPDSIAPQIASWPFGDAVALSFEDSDTSVRFVLIDEQGNRLRDEVLAPPAGERIFRAALASSPYGLVRAHARCRDDFSPSTGSLEVSLLGPTPDHTETLSAPIACPSGVLSVAVIDRLIFVLLSTEQGVQASLVAISG